MSHSPRRSPVKGKAIFAAILASALPLLAASVAEATTVTSRGFEGGSQLINCALGECFRPPDTMGAVGTTQYLETANGYIRIYDKNTGAVQSSVNMATFWAAAGLPGGANGDQRVLFDHYTNRWIVTGFGTSGNIVNIAVSQGANAMGPWQSTKIVGANVGLPGTTLDYPTLALDDKGVYIGTNNFTNTYTGSSVFVIPKTSLFGGAPSLTNMTTFTSLLGNGNTPQAALNWQGNPGNITAVMADSNTANDQVFYRLSGVNGPGATKSATATIVGSGYDVAGPARQPDGTRLVDTLSPRITANVVQVNGRLYSAHTVDDGTDHSAVRWSVVDAVTGALIDQGMISGGGYDYHEGSIAVNEFNQAVIGYNRSGFQNTDSNGEGLKDGNISFLAQAFTVDGAGGLDEFGSELLLRVSGISDYHCSTRVNPAPCRQRWGDYSAVTIDPLNHHSFYAIGEYASDWALLIGPDGKPIVATERAIWNTYIAEITFVPEPETYMLLLLGLALIAFLARRRPEPMA